MKRCLKTFPWVIAAFCTYMSTALSFGVDSGLTTVEQSQLGILPGKPRFEFHTGPNLSGVDFIADKGYSVPVTKTIPRLFIGAGVELGFMKKFLFLQPEINYVQKGFEQPLTNAGKFTVHLNYLELPVLVKVKVPTGQVRPYALLGPSVGVLVAQSLSATSYNPDGNVEATQSSSGGGVFRRYEVGATAGVGVEALINETKSVTLSLRYSRGLTDGFSDKISGASLYNTGLQILVGPQFLF